MKFKDILNILLLSCFLVGCQSTNAFENKILAEIKLCSNEEACIVNMSQVMDFEWDKMYVFNYNATYDDVKNVIGTDPPKFTEFARKIVFSLDDKIVYYKELSTDISTIIENQIVFDFSEAKNYKIYTLKSTTFKVKKEKIKGEKYFYRLLQYTNQ